MSNSVPFFNQRYQVHTNGDMLISGSIGYMTVMLYNQNNVTTEASPVTYKLEQEVGELMGYAKGDS